MNEAQRQRLKLMAARFSEWLQAINYSPKTRVNYTRERAWSFSIGSPTTLRLTPWSTSRRHTCSNIKSGSTNFERHNDNGNEATKEKEAKRLSVGTQAARPGGGAQVLLVAPE